MVEKFIALRYLGGKKSFISLTSFFSVLGITVGVAALIVVLSVMNGFNSTLTEKILGVNPHVIVMSYNHFFSEKRVAEIEKMGYQSSPFLLSQCIASSGRVSVGALIRGINFENAPVKRYFSVEKQGVIVGEELANILGIGVGDKVRLVFPSMKKTALGSVPMSWEGKINGIFNSGMYDYDASMIFIPLNKMQEILDMRGVITGMGIYLKNPFKARDIVRNMSARLSYPLYARSWMDMNRNFFFALKLEKVTMFIVLSLIVLVAILNILSSLTMSVMGKVKDIAVLVSMGATSTNIKKLFVIQGFILGLSGVAMGNILGFIICFVLKKYHFISLPSNVYYATTLPVDIHLMDVAIISLFTLFLSVFVSLYPAHKASKCNVIEVLK
ncbi:MAG: ABC transporter permease [Deltaproteobacteria bacterium]|nr:ABC transporter permease [Deltaproteobacteria bacterium]